MLAPPPVLMCLTFPSSCNLRATDAVCPPPIRAHLDLMDAFNISYVPSENSSSSNIPAGPLMTTAFAFSTTFENFTRVSMPISHMGYSTGKSFTLTSILSPSFLIARSLGKTILSLDPFNILFASSICLTYPSLSTNPKFFFPISTPSAARKTFATSPARRILSTFPRFKTFFITFIVSSTLLPPKTNVTG
jgi:hypothetical protein